MQFFPVIWIDLEYLKKGGGRGFGRGYKACFWRGGVEAIYWLL